MIKKIGGILSPMLLVVACNQTNSGTGENANVPDSTLQDIDTFNYENCPKAWSLEQALDAPDSFCSVAILANEDAERLTAIPDELKNIRHLRSLDVHGNKIASVPDFLVDLTELDLSQNSLKSFPAGLDKLKNLVTLDLSYNQISEISEVLIQLTKLEHLRLSSNAIKTLPDFLFEMTTLKTLTLWDNAMEEIPKEIGQLVQLEILDLSDLGSNGLQDLPVEFGNLTNLKFLYAGSHYQNGGGGHQFSEIPVCIFKLEKLVYLNLSAGNLETVDPKIETLTLLETLDLSDNQLTELPDEIFELAHLTYLDLSGNLFTEEMQAAILSRFDNRVEVIFEVEYGD